jgi:hypothetical protein
MWCAIELVSKLRARQGILGLDLTHRKKRSSGFKLFFKLRGWALVPVVLLFSPGSAVPVGKSGLKPVPNWD